MLGVGFLMTATLVISDIHPALRIVQEELMQGMVPNKPKVDIFMKRWFVFFVTMDHILAEHRIEFGITPAENPRPEHLPECKRKWKMETKTEMTMIHAAGCGTDTVISLQRRIPCKGREDGKKRG